MNGPLENICEGLISSLCYYLSCSIFKWGEKSDIHVDNVKIELIFKKKINRNIQMKMQQFATCVGPLEDHEEERGTR